MSDPQPPSGGLPNLTIFDLLDQAGISWRYYFQNAAPEWITAWSVYNTDSNKVVPMSAYFDDIKNEATFPQVVFIEENGNLDEHPKPNPGTNAPGQNIQNGAKNMAAIIGSLMASPSWKSSVFILAYDEGGGMRDHVVPPNMTQPDGYPPAITSTDQPGIFNQAGFRVPFVVVSPWTGPHLVSHINRDHTSILKLIETRFSLPPLTARDDAADNMTEFFNFQSPSWMTPPVPSGSAHEWGLRFSFGEGTRAMTRSKVSTVITRRQAFKLIAAAAVAGAAHAWSSPAMADTAAALSLGQIAQQKGLLYGSTVGKGFLVQDPGYADLVAHQCKIVVPETEMKWKALRPRPDSFVFDNADWILNWAQSHGIQVRGTALVWHEALPSWFEGYANQGNARDLLVNHIRTVLHHYAGKIHSWDVVNEGLTERGYRDTPWLRLLGPEYMEIAFQTAAEADPKAIRTYNDMYVEEANNDTKRF